MNSSWSAWPRRPLARVPDGHGATVLAERVRLLVSSGRDDGSPVDLDPICEAAGARVRAARLSAAEGMREALLVPLEGNRFGITVDPTPAGGWASIPAKLRARVRRHRLRFRIGHELGHCFAYSRSGGRPKRHLLDSPAQEAFCDRFSRALLVPEERAAATTATVDGLLALQESCDVSLQVAARALAEAQPDLTVELWFADSGTTLRSQWSSERPEAATVTRVGSFAEADSSGARWLAERRQLVVVG